MEDRIKIYSAAGCPYAQRSRLTLLEKGIAFEVIEIDLNHKPDWFAEVSPYGKVPVLEHGSDRIWESTIINEYLEDTFPEPPLLPSQPGQRAIARIWIDFANTKFTPAFYRLLLSQTPETQQEWIAELHKHLRFMESAGLAQRPGAGPYWLGDQVSLVDLSFYPWFERWSVLEHYRGILFPEDCERLQQWWQAMTQRASVVAIAQPATFHIQQYVKYADNSTTSTTAQELRR